MMPRLGYAGRLARRPARLRGRVLPAFVSIVTGVAMVVSVVVPTQGAEAAEDDGLRARWDLTEGHARDLSGHGHDGEAGPGVTYVEAGARFDGTDAGEITIPYAAEYQPEAITVGERWHLEIDDVVPSAVGGVHRAIMSGRADNDGWVVYIMPNGVIELWMAQNVGPGRYARAISGVVAVPGRSYDITAEWDGVNLSISVTGAGAGSGSGSLNGGYMAMAPDQPARFGNGGNAGTEFFFAGTIAAARISILPVVPEPPAEEVCLRDTGSDVAPIDWDGFAADLPDDEASATLRDITLNATRYITASWYPTRYGNQPWTYLNFGGTGELQIRGPAMAALGSAVPIALGTFDPDVVGLTEQEATDRVARMVASLAYRHRANSDGGWGDPSRNPQSPLWAFYAALAGWMLWDQFSPAEQVCVQNMVEYEADRIPEPRYYRDRTGTIISGGNTQAEEDSAWASLLGLATAMMPGHPQWQQWQQDNVELLIAAYARPIDTASGEMVNGRTVGDVLDGSNIENDGTVINHGFLHPIYMLAFDQSVNVALTSTLAGQHTPEAAFTNVDVVYDALVDLEFPAPPYREPGGTIYRPDSAGIYYPRGNDWGTSFPLYFGQADVIADSFGLDNLVDPGASVWADLHNADALAMQQRHADGHTYANNLESNYALKEERIAQIAGLTYLTRWLDHQDAVCVTARPYTTAESDPVLGELEAPAEASATMASLTTSLEQAGELDADQAERLRAGAANLDRLLTDIRSARSADDTAALTARVEQALSALAVLKTWLEHQVRSGDMSAAAGGQFVALADSANAGLSTLFTCLGSDVTATLSQADNYTGPGSSMRASVVVHNSSPLPVDSVAVDLAAPSGWSITPTSETTVRTLEAGATFTAEYDITVPVDAQFSWALGLTGSASYRTVGGGQVGLPVDAPILPAVRQ